VQSPVIAFTYTGAAAGANRDAGADPKTTAEPAQPQPVRGPLTLTGASEAVATAEQDTPGPEETTLRLRLRSSVAGGTVAAFGSAGSATRTRRLALDADGRLVFAAAGGDGTGPVNLRTQSAVTDGRWHDVVAVVGRDELRLYVDGKPVAARPVSPTDPEIGRWWLGGGLSGDLDDVAVLDRPLSSAEVASRHQAAPR